jgi:hypothetical protein
MKMAEAKEPERGGRKTQRPEKMTLDDLVLAFGLATRLRACEVADMLDHYLGQWLESARRELENRKELDRVREYLPLYFDPSRRQTVFGPGAPLTSQAAIERAIQPGKPVRAIAAG